MPIKIEIEGIEDFREFISLIRRRDVSLEEIKNLTKELNTSSNELEEAINAQKKGV